MCGANCLVTRFQDRSSVRMKTMFGRNARVPVADVAEVVVAEVVVALDEGAELLEHPAASSATESRITPAAVLRARMRISLVPGGLAGRHQTRRVLGVRE